MGIASGGNAQTALITYAQITAVTHVVGVMSVYSTGEDKHATHAGISNLAFTKRAEIKQLRGATNAMTPYVKTTLAVNAENAWIAVDVIDVVSAEK